jgi:tetratricopeptide (TPR) repeat protein
LSLATKAIDKVEGEQGKSAPLPMPASPRKKKKLWLILASVIILLGLGTGYLLFFRSSPDAPTKLTPRPTAAKRKPIKKDALVKTNQDQTKDSTAAVIPQVGEEQRKENLTKTSQKPAVESKMPPKTKISKQTTTTKEDETLKKNTAINKENTIINESKEPKAVSEVKLSHPEEGDKSEDESLEGYPGYASPESETKAELPLPSPKQEEKKESPPPLSPTKGKSLKAQTTSPEKGSSLESATSTESKAKEGGAYKVPEIGDKSDSRAQIYYKKGVSYQQEGKFSQALDSYQKALILNPGHEQARVNLASVLLQTGRFKEAEEQLILLHALRPKDQKILFNMGLLLYRLAQYPSAQDKLEQLLKINPFHLEACLLLASIHEEKGEMSKAVELCRQAYHIDTQSPAALYKLARALDISGERSEAAKFYQLYLKSDLGKDSELELAVHERLNYLLLQKEEK